MRKVFAGALLAATLGLGLAVAAPPAPASAQGIVITPNGVRIFPGDPDFNRWGSHFRRNVNRDDAIWIARRHGVGRIWDVDRRGSRWVVRGDNRRGPGGLRVTINAFNGRVIDVDRIRRR